MDHLAEGFAILPALSDLLHRIAKGNDCHDLDLGRDAQELADLGNPPKPVQFEATPFDQAVRIMDWTARLTSETA